MTDDFAEAEADFGALYRDNAAPKVEELYGNLKKELTPAELSGVAGGGAPPVNPVTAPKPSTQTASSGASSVMGRVKHLGITDVGQLRSKSEAELRTLSRDVVAYELRQTQLGKFFFPNPDGTWDYTRGPDGKPTGLDASGRVLPPEPPPAPAPAPVPTPSPQPAPPPAQPPIFEPGVQLDTSQVEDRRDLPPPGIGSSGVGGKTGPPPSAPPVKVELPPTKNTSGGGLGKPPPSSSGTGGKTAPVKKKPPVKKKATAPAKRKAPVVKVPARKPGLRAS